MVKDQCLGMIPGSVFSVKISEKKISNFLGLKEIVPSFRLQLSLGKALQLDDCGYVKVHGGGFVA